MVQKFQYVSCISWLCQYNIFDLVPLNGIISYEDLAASAKVPKQRLKSIIGMVMTNALFRQQPDGQSIGHSAMSALLARDNDMQAWASFMCKTSAPMALQMVAAHQRWGPNTVKKNETAYNVAFDTDLPFFDHVGSDESRVKEFAGYMRNVQKSEGVNLNHLVAGFAWADLQKDSIVVDVSATSPCGSWSFWRRVNITDIFDSSPGRRIDRQRCHNAGQQLSSSKIRRRRSSSQCGSRTESSSRLLTSAGAVSPHLSGP